jgi:myo-inositol-1(or 4)-monophosphatase
VSPAQGLAAELADLAVEVAREAAALVRERALGTVTVADTKTSAIDVVTQADRDTEALVRSLVLARRPDDAILGEEGDDVAGTSGVRWVVDPIDGTVNFLYGIPQYAVSLAAEVDGEVVAGVVLDVAKRVEYVARPGADGTTVALRDGVPIGVGPQRPLGQRLIGTGFSYVTDVKVVQVAAVGRLLPRIRDVRRLGSCALDLCHVAEGRLDGYVEEGVNLWDHAAGGLIARAAGARTETGPGAGGLTALLCAPSHGFDELHQATREAGFWAE